MKEFTSTVTLTFEINNLSAFDKEEYIERLKEQYIELYDLEIKDHEITNIEEVQPLKCNPSERIIIMKFLVTKVKFDFDEGDIDDPITFEEQVQITHDSLGVWEADDEDDLIEEITTASGWCIKSIDYDIQLK